MRIYRKIAIIVATAGACLEASMDLIKNNFESALMAIRTSWQALSDKDPSQADPITRAVITAINNMLIDLMAAMSHKGWLSRRQRKKQGIERAYPLGKYRGKQADRKRQR